MAKFGTVLNGQKKPTNALNDLQASTIPAIVSKISLCWRRSMNSRKDRNIILRSRLHHFDVVYQKDMGGVLFRKFFSELMRFLVCHCSSVLSHLRSRTELLIISEKLSFSLSQHIICIVPSRCEVDYTNTELSSEMKILLSFRDMADCIWKEVWFLSRR